MKSFFLCIVLFNLSILDSDPQEMHKVYDRWPELARKSYESDADNIDLKGIDHIVFSGMRGSGAVGDVFSSILSKSDVHVST